MLKFIFLKQNRQKLLEAAGDVGTAGANLLNSMGGQQEVESGIQVLYIEISGNLEL